MRDGFDRCEFVIAKDDGKTAVCRERLFCHICNYCHKHCLDHVNMREVVVQMTQDKKAITG